MFELLFKYPIPVFTKGKFVLLGAWPGWLLPLLIAVSTAGLAYVTWSGYASAAPGIRNWRIWSLWAMESLLLAVLLVLLWEPAVTVAELKSQQNMIAILVDDSRSMAIADSGASSNIVREAEAVNALNSGILSELGKKFQTRLYSFDRKLARIDNLGQLHATATATHLGDGLKQLVAETSDLPVGAVLVLSDGSENSGGIDSETIDALRNRRLPIHTIGFGAERMLHDVEMEDVVVATRSMADSRMRATVSFHQRGYAGATTALEVREDNKVLASRKVVLAADGVVQTQTLFFNSGEPAVKSIEFLLSPLGGEENVANNTMTKLVEVSAEKRRILYVEGEPRWEYKFIRRAEDDDHGMQLVSMLRTTENKIYRQGIGDPSELADGFPSKAEDLFKYQAIVIGSVEAGYFTPAQQELLREFIDKRGGGVLFLGGRFSLSDGGWGSSSVADLLPTFLPNAKDTFHRDAATTQLTAAGMDSPVTRLVDDPAKNKELWKKLPYINDYQDPGTPKPGATVLAEMIAGRTMPMLVTQSYGRGRTAVMATSGTWRWQMSQPLGDPTHDLFWQQLLRWLAADSPDQVTASMPEQTLMDEGHVKLTAIARDKQFTLAADAHVSAHLIGPDGLSEIVDMSPVQNAPGTFAMDWTAQKPGSYLAEVTAGRGTEELGKQVLPFRRVDGVAESFHTEQNSELLKELSADTGGRYWKEDELNRLQKEISYSEAGMSVRDTKELWNMPAVFLMLLGLISAQWLLRRKWGVI